VSTTSNSVTTCPSFTSSPPPLMTPQGHLITDGDSNPFSDHYHSEQRSKLLSLPGPRQPIRLHLGAAMWPTTQAPAPAHHKPSQGDGRLLPRTLAQTLISNGQSRNQSNGAKSAL
jgi:hypothetical protein